MHDCFRCRARGGAGDHEPWCEEQAGEGNTVDEVGCAALVKRPRPSIAAEIKYCCRTTHKYHDIVRACLGPQCLLRARANACWFRCMEPRSIAAYMLCSRGAVFSEEGGNCSATLRACINARSMRCSKVLGKIDSKALAQNVHATAYFTTRGIFPRWTWMLA